ncbi:MAG: general secretion pathway protein GspB [Steroidobacteraceae bacterium]
MSFILDALKKAESERNRQSGPVLMDVRIAPPRRRLPGWAWVLGGVLLANLLVLAWLLLRRPAPQAAPATAATTVAPAVVATPSAVIPPAAPPAYAPPAYAVPPPALLPPDQTGLPAPLPLPGATAPGAGAAATPTEPAADVENLPTYQDLVAAGIALPPLALNLHVFDANPANRYVLLNSMRLREGDFTPDGIKLESITARGAVLNQRGRRFLLSAGG